MNLEWIVRAGPTSLSLIVTLMCKERPPADSPENSIVNSCDGAASNGRLRDLVSGRFCCAEFGLH